MTLPLDLEALAARVIAEAKAAKGKPPDAEKLRLALAVKRMAGELVFYAEEKSYREGVPMAEVSVPGPRLAWGSMRRRFDKERRPDGGATARKALAGIGVSTEKKGEK